MPIERFMVPGEMEPVSHYCHVVRAGDFIYLSGTGQDEGRWHHSIRHRGPVRDCLEVDRLPACATRAGGPTAVIKVLVFTDRHHGTGEHQSDTPALPSGTTGPRRPWSRFKALVDPRMKVEIEAVAYIGE